MTAARRYRWLPGVLAELASAAGIDAALKLAEAKGGARIFVPKRCSDRHHLVALLGRAGADALTSLYGGEEISVPVGPRGGLAAMQRRCDEALRRGASADKAARESGMTWRTAYRRKRRLKAAATDPQGRLF